jgi:hypothetical protein
MSADVAKGEREVSGGSVIEDNKKMYTGSSKSLQMCGIIVPLVGPNYHIGVNPKSRKTLAPLFLPKINALEFDG